MSSNYQVQLFWNQEFILAAALIGGNFFHFSIVFSDSERKLKNWQRFLIYAPNVAIVWAVLTPGVLIQDIKIRDWGNESILGWGYIYYGIYFSVLWLLSAYNLIKKYIRSKGIFKAQLRYILIGTMLSMFLGSVFDLFFILLGNYRWIWLGPYASFTFALFSTYAIVRYRLMDIRLVVKKVYIYLGLAIFAYVIFYLTDWLYISLYGNVFSFFGFLTGIFIAPIFIIVLLSIHNVLKRIADKYIFTELYNYQKTITKLSQDLNHSIDLQKITDLIVETIKQTMRLNRAGVLLIDQNQNPTLYRIAKVIGFNEQNGISLVKDNFLTQYLEKTQKPIVRDELTLLVRDSKNKKDQQSFEKLYQHMERIEASLCLPLMSSKRLMGIIVLGSKMSGDAYSQEDLELLSTLANQAGVAFDNAKLYKEVQDFSKTLQQKGDGQTKDISEKNKYLQELLNMKTDFLRVVNHQLNTPLSIMRNAFAMVKEKIITPEKGFSISDSGLERMSQTIADFWDAFELEGEKMKMNPDKTNIEEIVNNLIEEKKKMTLVQERQLTFSLKKPKFKIPIIWCDPKKIVHVVSNLLDNAAFYTTQGSVTVSYELVGRDYLKINIKDTGVGISQENEKKLFQKFSRGNGSTSLHPDGSGLGLYVAKKIVEGNDGEITFFSEGAGKGSTFSFSIPCYTNQKPINPEPVKGNSNMLTNIAKK